MGRIISICENGINFVMEITDDRDVRLLHFSQVPFDMRVFKDEEQKKRSRLIEIQISGQNQDDHHGLKHTRTSPGYNLEYVEHRDYRNDTGRKLEIILEYKKLQYRCGIRDGGRCG